MLQICRTCLKEINDMNFISLGDATSLTDSLKIKDILTICVPEMVLDIIADPVMCETCMTALHVAYDFKRKCLRTEERIRSYVHHLVVGSKDIDIITMITQENHKQTDMDVDDSNKEPGGFEPDRRHIKQEPPERAAKAADSGGKKKHKKRKSKSQKQKSDDIADGERLRRALQSPPKHVCSQCGKRFQRKSALLLHERIHIDAPTVSLENTKAPAEVQNGEKLFSCTMCDFSDATKASLLEHMKIHIEEEILKCIKCPFIAKTDTELDEHLLSHDRESSDSNDDTSLHDKESDESDEDSLFSDDIAAIFNNNGVVNCPRCSFSAKDSAELQNHLKDHGKQKLFDCPECPYTTSVKCNLQRHLQVHSGQKAHKCPTCNYCTATESRLQRHMRVHAEGAEVFKCKDCNYCTSTESRLSRHMSSHTEDVELFRCKDCSFSTSVQRRFWMHRKLHSSNQLPYTCAICDYTATCKVHLIKHMRTHTGERPFKCHQCDFTASHSFSLKRHMTVHSDEKPFKCNLCNYMAKRRTYLLDHIRTHTGEKPYKCNQCEYTASRRPMLLSHQKIHEEEASAAAATPLEIKKKEPSLTNSAQELIETKIEGLEAQNKGLEIFVVAHKQDSLQNGKVDRSKKEGAGKPERPELVDENGLEVFLIEKKPENCPVVTT